MRNRPFAVLVAAALLCVSGSAVSYVGRPTVPDEAVRTAVTRSEALIERAWALPVAARFGHVVDWQSNGSLCGAASLANVFRSLGEKAADTEDEVLEGAGSCWFGVCPFGLTLDQTAQLASAGTGRRIEVLRDLTPERFKEILKDTNDPKRRYVVNFSRRPIFGAGVGHISPIGGYLEKEDLVFVLDVNRAFRPWLVERSRLFEAVDTLDGAKKRGLLRIE